MVLSWACVEIPRYAFYTFKELGVELYPLTWLRYSLFSVLYPSGISGELMSIYVALPYIFERGMYTLTMPNAYNFSFDYGYAVLFAAAMYLPGSPFMYSHMVKQRKKVLKKLNEPKKAKNN
jgi:very-long-chain (3R)-3-hydroxyacyl-CoA dehydratase